jgi:hypothetical protein
LIGNGGSRRPSADIETLVHYRCCQTPPQRGKSSFCAAAAGERFCTAFQKSVVFPRVLRFSWAGFSPSLSFQKIDYPPWDMYFCHECSYEFPLIDYLCATFDLRAELDCVLFMHSTK